MRVRIRVEERAVRVTKRGQGNTQHNARRAFPADWSPLLLPILLGIGGCPVSVSLLTRGLGLPQVSDVRVRVGVRVGVRVRGWQNPRPWGRVVRACCDRTW